MKLESYTSWKAGRKTRKPLRSALELAKELGVTMAQLRGYLAAEGAPKPEMVQKRTGCYYDPEAFKRWFAGIRRAH